MNSVTPRQSELGGASSWNVALGIWVLISPYILHYGHNTYFLWNNVIVGIAICVLALVRSTGNDPRGVCSWLNVLLGLWLIVSPFVLGFSHMAAPMWNNIILGIIIALIAGTSVSTWRESLPGHLTR